MIYALCSEGMSYGDADGVLEYPDEAAAREAFREYVLSNRHRIGSIASRYLFRTREDAVAANQSTDDEVLIDEDKAFRTLEYERGYGFNF